MRDKPELHPALVVKKSGEERNAFPVRYFPMESKQMKFGCGRLLLMKQAGGVEPVWNANVLSELPTREEYGNTAFGHFRSVSAVCNAQSAADLRKRLAGQEKQGKSQQVAAYPADKYTTPGKSLVDTTGSPRPAEVYSKYGDVGIVNMNSLGSLALPSELKSQAIAAANRGLSASTHSAYETANRKFLKCLEVYGIEEEWPISRAAQVTFVAWCVEIEKLAPSTVRTYLSALGKVSAIKSGTTMQVDELSNLILKGAENTRTKKKKVAMNLHSMARLRERIVRSKHNAAVKDLLWAVATVALHGCFRCGELLQSVKKGSKEPSGGLLLKDVARKTVVVKGREVVLYELTVKDPKEKKGGGDVVVEIFSLGAETCAVTALERHLARLGKNPKNPALFQFPEGNSLTKQQFHRLLRKLLLDLPGYEDVGTHSFRRALPSLMARAGFSQSDIMRQGRWSSQVSCILFNHP